MSIRHGKDARIYVNGYDFSGDVTAVSGKMANEVVEYAVLDGGQYHYFRGLGKDEIGIDGLLDTTAAVQLDALHAATDGYQMVVVLGSTAGDPALAAAEVKLQDYEKKAVTTDINRISFKGVTNDYPFDHAKSLHPKAQRTDDGIGTTLDNTSSSADGAVGYLQVFEQTGGTGLTVSIRHSTDNFVADNTQLLAFTAATGRTTERVAVTGTVKRYVRAIWDFAGAGPYTGTFVVVMKRI